MRGYYDRDEPPKGGAPNQLWRWWTKLFGEPPDEIVSIYPSPTDLENGCAKYRIEYKNATYLIWNVAQTIQHDKSWVDKPHLTDHQIWLD